MSDEVREAKAGEAATVNENQEEQITKPAPKVKPQKEKDPKKVAAGKKLAEKNRQAKAALERELKREIAEREQENENSAGWLPEMSFQTVLSIVVLHLQLLNCINVFVQNQVLEVPKVRFLLRQNQNTATAELEKAKRRAKTLETSKSEGLSIELTSEAPSVQKSEWPERSRSEAQSADQRSIINLFFLTTKMSEQNKLVKMVTDSAVLVGLTAGVGYLAKKILKENFLGDPSSNVMNYAKFTGVLAGSMALKTYLEDQKILPKSI